MSTQEEQLQLFISLTGTENTPLALQILEQNNWEIDASVDFYYNNQDIVDTPNTSSKPTSTGNESPTKSNNNKSPPIMVGGDDEDYSEQMRDPIPQHMDTLVEPSYHDAYRSRRTNQNKPTNVFESFRDFEKEKGLNQDKLTGKQKTLAELFRPPLEILSYGGFEEIKQKARDAKKFIMVNVQDVQEFACQRLNRDTWSNPKLKELIGANFIMWQVNNVSEEGKWFTQYYPTPEFPYIALIDPRTGEELANNAGFIEAEEMKEYLNTFLRSNSYEKTNSLPPSEMNKNLKKKKYVTEEEELEMAIQLSLANSKSPTYSSTDSIKVQVDNIDKIDTTSTTSTSSTISKEEIIQPNKKLKKDEDEDLEEDYNDIDDDIDYQDLDKHDNKKEKMEIEKKSEEQPPTTIGLEGDCIIQIKLPDQTIKGNFKSTDLIKNLYYFVQLKSGKFNFKLLTTFPKVELTGPIMNKSLKEMDLTPRAQLMFQQE